MSHRATGGRLTGAGDEHAATGPPTAAARRPRSWPSSTTSTRPGATGSRCLASTRLARHVVADRLAHEREQLRPLPPGGFDAAGRRSSRVPADGYLKFGRCFYRAPEALVQRRVELRWDRDRVWIEHHGHQVADYRRSYEHGTWQPAPRLRPEPPPVAELIPLPGPQVIPPALSDYAELCA